MKELWESDSSVAGKRSFQNSTLGHFLAGPGSQHPYHSDLIPTSSQSFLLSHATKLNAPQLLGPSLYPAMLLCQPYPLLPSSQAPALPSPPPTTDLLCTCSPLRRLDHTFPLTWPRAFGSDYRTPAFGPSSVLIRSFSIENILGLVTLSRQLCFSDLTLPSL